MKTKLNLFGVFGRTCLRIVFPLAVLSVFSTRLLAAPYDENWDDRFGKIGGGDLGAVAVVGTDLYATGNFELAIARVDNGLGRWNGRIWAPLGSGLTNYTGGQTSVATLKADGTNLYAGGNFTRVIPSGLFVNGVARWDGNNWFPLGGGVNGTVRAIAVVGNTVYVGGQFTSAGGVAATNIAKWDGANWSALGGGLTQQPSAAYVSAIAIMGNNDVIAGGLFNRAGGVNAINVARWNGTTWSPLSTGVNSSVNALLVDNGTLYAAGGFAVAGGVPASSIARWDGVNWFPLGAGTDSAINTLAKLGNYLYAGGSFLTAGTTNVTRIARWDGIEWSAVGSGVSQASGVTVEAMTTHNNELYVCGNFLGAGGVTVNGIAKWDGTNWSAFGEPLNQAGFALTHNGTNVYVGGDFSTAGGLVVSNIARWDGTNWFALRAGVNASVTALATDGSNVYAGGNFTRADGLPLYRIGKWDGTNWSSLGSGLTNGTVLAVAVSGTNVYVGGSSISFNGTTVHNIVRWDGNNWSAVAGSGAGFVYALTVSGTNLYAGGSIAIAGGSKLARWDGNAWTGVGNINGAVTAIAVKGNDIYVGCGNIIGVPNTTGIAKWNGSDWSALGTGTGGAVNSIGFRGNDVIAGGDFTTAGGLSVWHVARWDGVAWSPFGSGTAIFASTADNTVNGLGIIGDELFITGDFTGAGWKPSMYFGIWHFPRPIARLAALQPGSFLLNWTSESNKTYRVHGTTNLSQPFAPLSGLIPSGGTNTSYTNAIGTPAQYFRIEEVQL